MPMSRFVTAASIGACVAALGLSAPASAYWEYGHETVAEIAMANVKPATRIAVRRLLAKTAILDTPECPATTVEGASTWADCVKKLKNPDGKPRFGYAYTWHFQDVNICKPFSLVEPCKDGNCVSAQIERDVATLRDRHAPQKDKVQALVFLIHFVGDLHQPLHAGEKDDKGGNDRRVARPSLPRGGAGACRRRLGDRLEPRKLAARARRGLHDRTQG